LEVGKAIQVLSAEEIDCYRGIVWAEQLGANAARTNNFFRSFFFYF